MIPVLGGSLTIASMLGKERESRHFSDSFADSMNSLPLTYHVTLLVALLAGFFIPATVDAQAVIAREQAKVISVAPDGAHVLRRLPEETGERGQAQKAMEIATQSGKVLYRWVSPIGAVTVLWSPDGSYLAVNEAPGEGGDQLRVFKVGNTEVIPVREPSSLQLRRAVEERHGSFLSQLDEVVIRGIEWRDGRLWCDVHGSQFPKRQPSVRVPFHDLWVLSFRRDEPLVEEVWSRTEPHERAYRNE